MDSGRFTHNINCPLCNKPGDVLFSRDPRPIFETLTRGRRSVSPDFYSGTKYELLYCSGCRHYFQSFIPRDAYVDIFVEEQSEQSLHHAQTARTGDILRNIESIELLSGKKSHVTDVLEFGCGWGYWLLTAKGLGYNVTGVEIAPGRAAHARGNGIRIVKALTELADQRFDYIHADQVLEHTMNPRVILNELVGHLKPGGIVFISVPNGDQFQRKYTQNPERIYKQVFPFEHVHCFTHHSLVKLGATAGLVPVSSATIFRTFLPHIGLSGNAHLLQEAAKIAFRQRYRTAIYFSRA